MERDGRTVSLYVDAEAYARRPTPAPPAPSATTTSPCRRTRPCETAQSKVDCSICHADAGQPVPGQHPRPARRQGDPDAPGCLDCHEQARHHQTTSCPAPAPTPRNVPELCGTLPPRRGRRRRARIDTERPGHRRRATHESIHGKGLMQSGLVVSATCADCHTVAQRAARRRPPLDGQPEQPRRHLRQLPPRHRGDLPDQRPLAAASTKTDKKLPACEDCHTSHTITRTDAQGFRCTG